MENIYEKTLAALTDALQKETPESMMEMMENLEYDGFDPESFAALIKKIGLAAKRDWAKDVITMVSLAVLRGTNVTKIKKKVSEKGKKQIDALVAAYKIMSSSKGSQKDVVSLGRVVATFPLVAAMLIAKNPRLNTRLANLNQDLQPFLAFPGANALIPKSETRMHQEYEKFAQEFSKLVISKQDAKTQALFVEITKNSPITGDDEQREENLAKVVAIAEQTLA
jgi:hypothetical protein